MCEATKKKIEVMQAFVDGKIIEALPIGYYDDWSSWSNASDEPNWNWENLEYRVKESTKPSIDWSHVSDKFKWMATDEDGETFLFEVQPTVEIKTGRLTRWQSREGDHIYAPFYSSFKPGDCDWKDSLVKREE